MARLAAPDDGHAAQLGIVAPGTAAPGAVVDAVVTRLGSHEVPILWRTGRRAGGRLAERGGAPATRTGEHLAAAEADGSRRSA